MGYAELFSYHVMPICRMHKQNNGAYSLGTWIGTGFTFGEGTFVTCWHCVGGSLADGDAYVAVGREKGLAQNTRDLPIELHQLARDANGSDLALARINVTVRPFLNLAADPLEWGDDVVACGFAHTMDTMNPDTGLKRIETHARVFKGYVTRLFRDTYQDDELVVELAMSAPVGMSGAPVFRVQRHSGEPFECFGVVFGERVLETPEGTLQFGNAFRLDTLRNATGPATDNLPLAEYLTRSARGQALSD